MNNYNFENAINVKNTDKNKAAIAAFDFPGGATIARFTSKIFKAPHMHTICIGDQMHIKPSMNVEYLSHACGDAANCRVVPDPKNNSITVQTIKPISAGDELSFDYNTTEWEMHSPFQCVCAKCKASDNRTMVRGFKYLPPLQRLEIIRDITPYIAYKAAQACACKLKARM